MFISPIVAAIVIGSFWTGVATTAVVNHDGGLWSPHPRSDVVISAQTDDHVSACHARYRSYDETTDQYLSSRDGQWHTCQL